MPECPYCGKWFRSKKGLQQHITKTHKTTNMFGEKVIDPCSVDPIGKIERRAERAQKKKKKKGGLFGGLF